MGPGTHVDVVLARITHLNLVLSHTDEEQMTLIVWVMGVSAMLARNSFYPDVLHHVFSLKLEQDEGSLPT